MTRLDILSDPICPWCYIGKVRLDAAIAEAGVNPFAIRWRIFRLNPDMQPDGMDRRAYLEGKFGGPAGAAEVYGRIEQIARGDGLTVNFDRIKRTPDTMNAHRLLRWAETEDRQGPVADQLFHRYFVEGEDISDPAVLTAIAESAGLDAAVIARLLEGDQDRETLDAEDAEARRMGVGGVPCFVIGGRYVLQGAQETETWVRVIRELTEAQAAVEEGGAPR